MDKVSYLAIKNQLSFERKFAVTALVLIVDLLVAVYAFKMAASGNILLFILSQIMLAFFYFHNFALLHEAGHGNISKKEWVNSAVGFYTSPFCFLPYFPWKYIHNEHHIYTGNLDKDPTMKNLKIIKRRGKVPFIAKFAWRSWVPLAGFAQHFVFWLYPIVMLRSGEMNRKVFIQSVASVLYIPLVYLILHSVFPVYVNWGNVWMSLLIYLVLVELVNLPHHSDMPYFDSNSSIKKLHAWEQQKTTRSCYYPYHLSEILALNFNFHTEHHYFPSLPWYRLRKARNIIKAALGKEYTELYGIGWNIQNRRRNPDEIFLADKRMG